MAVRGARGACKHGYGSSPLLFVHDHLWIVAAELRRRPIHASDDTAIEPLGIYKKDLWGRTHTASGTQR